MKHELECEQTSRRLRPRPACRRQRAPVPRLRAGIDNDHAEDLGQDVGHGMGLPLRGSLLLLAGRYAGWVWIWRYIHHITSDDLVYTAGGLIAPD